MKKSFRRLDTMRLDMVRLEDRVTPSAANYTPPTYFLWEPGEVNSRPSSGEPLDIARSFLAERAADFHLRAADLAGAKVTSMYTDDDSGTTHIYLRQVVNGLEVAFADLNVSVAADGHVISAGGGFVPGLAAQLDARSAQPQADPRQAVEWAATGLGLAVKSPLHQVYMASNDAGKSALIASPISQEPISAKLQYVPTADGGAALAWSLIILTPDGNHWYDVSIADRTGAVAAVCDWVDDAGYHAMPLPHESPQDGGFFVVSDPHDVAASPFGWHDNNGVAGPEFTDTRGNNVDAHLDRDANNSPDTNPPRPAGGAALDFSSYTFDPALEPPVLQNQNAAMVNLFVTNNILHDLHYKYGFTPAAGNFQTNNYGQGGLANDAVNADAQDGLGTNNANFGTPVDGIAPRMQMYIWTAASPDRDSDLDNGVIIHEYGHGVSNRLTGGPANSNALDNVQSGGMGEGWSDFYALMFMQRPTDTQMGSYGIGTYLQNQPQSGTGIRAYPYSFNMAIDPIDFDSYGPSSSGATSYGLTRSTAVHRTGTIWNSTLWDMNWLLINKYGFDADITTGWGATPGPANAGNKLTLKLVMDAMKLQPANPSFIQARDAILAADTALTGGANHLQIWTAFARRGLGENASTPGSSSTAQLTLDFNIPAALQKLNVDSTVPAVGSVATTQLTSYTLNVSEAIDPLSLGAGDFTVNGTPATAFLYTPGSTSVTFNFLASPATVNGLQTMAVAANAFTRASDGGPVNAFSANYRYDALPLAVTSTTPAAGSTQAPPLTQFDLNLNEAVDPATVSASDLYLSAGYVTGFTLLNGNQTIRYTLAGLGNEASLTANVAAGKFRDAAGNPNLAFTGSYTLDFATRVFPALAAVNPLGSRVYRGTSSGLVNNGSDVDEFTISLDAGQTLEVLLTPAANLQPRVTILSPALTVIATESAPSDGVAITPQASIPATGIYTIRVDGLGGSSGTYSLAAALNVAQETETVHPTVTNNTAASSQPLPMQIVATSLGGAVRGSVLGTTDLSTVYTAAPATFAFEDISGTGTTILASADDKTASFAIPFNFNFYGTNYTTVFLSDNGLITFGSGTTSNTNGSLTSSPAQASIAALWDDLEMGPDGVKWQVLGSPGSRRAVIQWENGRYWTSGNTGTFTLQFQAVLFEGSNQIRFNYVDLDGNVASGNGGKSASIGIKNAGASDRLLLSQNNTSIYHGNNTSTIISPPAPTRDFYRFSASAGDAVTLVQSTLSGSTPTLELLGPDGTTVLATATAGPTNFSTGVSNFVVPGGGTYYASVGGGAISNYSLMAVIGSFDSEANDAAASPQPLGPGRTAYGHAAAGNDDWYSLVLPAGMSILKAESATPGDGAGEPVNALDPTVRIYDAAGTTLLASGVALADGRNELATATGLAGGATYLVRIQGAAGSSGEYALRVETSAPVNPTVATVELNDGATQRSRLTRIEVTFSTEVTIAPGAFTLQRGATTLSNAPGGGILQNTALVGSQTVATLSFDSAVSGVEFGSLADGIWTLTALAAGITAISNGQPMSANYVQTGIKRLFGDGNADATVDGVDMANFGSYFGSTFQPGDPAAAFDFNADNTIDAVDLAEFGNRFGMSI